MAFSILYFIEKILLFLISGILSVLVGFFSDIIHLIGTTILTLAGDEVNEISSWGIYAPIAIILSFAVAIVGLYAILDMAMVVNDVIE